MNMMQLVQCLTVEEKRQLKSLLSKDELSLQQHSSQLPIHEWCELLKPCARLWNALHVIAHRDKDKTIVSILSEDLLNMRNVGEKCWQEFVELRGF